MLSAAALSPNARRLFPLLDPTVGRAVGAYFQFQKNEGKPESLEMKGDLNDGNPNTPDRVQLQFDRVQDGSVLVKGTYAGQEVEARITKQPRQQLRERSNLIWGQAGESSEKTQANIRGQVGQYPLEGWVTTHRQEVDIEMTPELRDSGKAIYTLPFALSVTPTFGGAPARVNGLPGDVPTASTPLQTTDRTNVNAKVGDLSVKTEQNWTTTTWTVSTNLRAGGSRVTMMQSERAAEVETYQHSSQRSTEERDYEVESGRSAIGTDRNYELDFSAGVVAGSMRAGESRLTFELSPRA